MPVSDPGAQKDLQHKLELEEKQDWFLLVLGT